jgi:hypothetical protein
MSNLENITNEKLSARKFVGIWVAGGFILGVMLAMFKVQSYAGSIGERIAEMIGGGMVYALLGAAIGAAVQYFFRSKKK